MVKLTNWLTAYRVSLFLINFFMDLIVENHFSHFFFMPEKKRKKVTIIMCLDTRNQLLQAPEWPVKIIRASLIYVPNKTKWSPKTGY